MFPYLSYNCTLNSLFQMEQASGNSPHAKQSFFHWIKYCVNAKMLEQLL